MTIALGFIYKDGVVLASDSQMSWQDFKQWNSNKIVPLEFEGPNYAILAKSGNLGFGAYFEEILRAKAQSAKITRPRSIADTVEEALKEARNNALSAYYHPSLGEGCG